MFLDELGTSPNKETLYTPYALLRLLADKLDVIPDKVLYLDVDVMAYDDIGKLFRLDISDYELAGVRDYYGKIFFYPRYLNSGVLLMNMKKIRKTQMLSKALDMCRRKKVFLPDQTAINKYTNKKLILPRKYNEQKKMHSDTIVRHFTMTLKFFQLFRKQNIKTWNIDDVHKILKSHHFDDVFEEYRKIKENIKNERNNNPICNI